jgi:hypothetical protein
VAASPAEWIVVMAIASLPLVGGAMAVSSLALPMLEWPSIFVLSTSVLLYAGSAMLWWVLDSQLSVYLGTWCLACFLAFAAFNRGFRARPGKGSAPRKFELESSLGVLLVVAGYAGGYVIRG